MVLHKIYFNHVSHKSDRQSVTAVITTDKQLSEIKDGFWVDEDYIITDTTDVKFFIPYHSIIAIEKMEHEEC